MTLSEVKTQLDELEKIIMFETDKKTLRWYIEDYVAFYFLYVAKRREIEAMTWFLN
jgi:hypothetical protein